MMAFYNDLETAEICMEPQNFPNSQSYCEWED